MSFFGTNIKKIRQIKGLSQKAFADLFELNRGVISAYEEGRAEPKIETLLKVAHYFDLDLDKFLTETLQVNQLVSSSDIDQLMFTTDHSQKKSDTESQVISEKDHNQTILQKILANTDLIYEFKAGQPLLSYYQTGDILFLNKAGSKETAETLVFINDLNSLEYASKSSSKEKNSKTLYKISGFVSLEQKNILSSILERIENLESK
ncbi:helix-turn-helix domain-containing protein [Chryseobacterium sp.]|uniref:helix-turn-helix domain-containing protein n=1 Tax=Chryseobacterium sp. TaxID=1871047 RepID=UPI0025C3F07F|nr:helix-turn-helix domain-containing protein [Chryseobacterium sp.]